MIKNLPAMWETWVWSLGWEDPLEKEMATHSSILAWRIPWTEEPGRLWYKGSQRIRHDWETFTSLPWKKMLLQSCFYFLSSFLLPFFHSSFTCSHIHRYIDIHINFKQTSESWSVVSDSLWPHGLYSPWILQIRILEWVAFPFSRGSSQPRNGTQISHIAGGFFTSWARREAQEYWSG